VNLSPSWLELNVIDLAAVSSWAFMIKYLCAEKEKTQDVQRDQRGEGRVAGCAWNTSASEARGKQEARKKR
jgi:hypothetical protein